MADASTNLFASFEVGQDSVDLSATFHVGQDSKDLFAKFELTTIEFSLKEHDRGYTQPPTIVFSKPSASEVRGYSTPASSQGSCYFFFNCSRTWLHNKYLRWRWSASYTYTFGSHVRVYDGEYDRSSDVDFPPGAPRIDKGNGLLQILDQNSGSFAAETVEAQVDTSGGNQDNVAVMFFYSDAWTAQQGYLQLYWVEINEGAGGADRLFLEPFNAPLNMEVLGTTNDYGYISDGQPPLDGAVKLFAKFEVGQGSEDLFAKFLPRYVGTEDLFAKFESQAVLNLFSKFDVGQGSEALFAEAVIRQSETKDLFSKFLVRHGSYEDLFAKFSTYIGGSEDLFATFEVGQDSEDLFTEFIIRHTASQELLAEFGVKSWLGGWGKRKSFTVTGTADGAQTDYAICVKVYYGAGVDGTEAGKGVTMGKVYCDSKCQTDFGDIRWTRDDGITELDYWMEEYSSGSYAIFWVETRYIPASPNTKDIYLYYETPANSTTTSDGDATFIIFDHFLGSSLDTDKWVESGLGGNTITVEDSYLKCNMGGTNTYDINSKNAYDHADYMAVMSRVDIKGLATEGYACLSVGRFFDRNASVVLIGARWYREGAYDRRIYGVGGAWWAGAGKGAATGVSRHELTFPSDDDQIKWFVEGVKNFNDTGSYANYFPSASERYVNWNVAKYAANHVWLDWIATRPRAQPEPTPTSWGPEETNYQDLFAKFDVGQGSENLFAKFTVLQDNEDLFAEFIVRQTATLDLKAIFDVGQDSKDLFSKLIIRHPDSEDLFAEFIVRQEDTEDLFAKFEVGQDSADLFAEFAVFNYPRTVGPSTVATASGSYPIHNTWLRGQFYAHGRHFIVYGDGTGFVYKHSSDEGATWSAPVTLRATIGTLGNTEGVLSMHFDGVYLHYAMGWNTFNQPLRYRRGRIEPNGSITWSAAEQVVVAADANYNHRNLQVTADSQGYPIVSYLHFSFADTYPYVTKSSTNDGTWITETGYPLQLSSVDLEWGTQVVSLGSKRLCVAWSTYVPGPNTYLLYTKIFNGSSWEADEPSITMGGNRRYSIAPGANSSVLLSYDRGNDMRFRSRPWGGPWGAEVKIFDDTQGINNVVARGPDANTIYVFQFPERGLYPDLVVYAVSTDGGATWTGKAGAPLPYTWIDETIDDARNVFTHTSGYRVWDGVISFAYITKDSAPYNVRYAALRFYESEDLKATFEVGQDSADLKAIFHVGQSSENLFAETIIRHSVTRDLFAEFIVRLSATEDLFAEVIVRQSGTRDLFAEFIAGAEGDVDLFAKFEVRQEATQDLFAKFTVQYSAFQELFAEFEIQDSEDLFAKFTIRQADYQELFAKFTVGQEDSEDLFAEFIIRQEAIQDLFAEAVIRQLGAQDLFSEFVVRQTETEDLFAKFTVRHSDVQNLFAEVIIRHTGTKDLFSEFVVRQTGTANLFTEFTVRHTATQELFAEFVIRQSGTAELFSEFTVRQTGTANLFAEFEIQDSEDLFAKFTVRQTDYQELFAKFTVGQEDSEDLFADFIVRQETTRDLFAEAIIRQTGEQDLFAEFEIQDSEDLFTKFTIRRTATEDLYAKFSVLNAGSQDLYAKLSVRQSGFQELFSQVIIRQAAYQELFSEAIIRQTGTRDLFAEFTVRQIGTTDLFAEFIARQSTSLDLFSKFTVRQKASQDLFSEFIIRQAISEDLFATFTIRSPSSVDLFAKFDVQSVFTLDLFARATIRHTDTAELLTIFTIRHTDYQELFAEFTVQHIYDLFAQFTVRHPDSQDLYAKFSVLNAGSQDLFSRFRVKPAEQTVDLFAFFRLRESLFLELWGEFVVRQLETKVDDFFVQPTERRLQIGLPPRAVRERVIVPTSPATKGMGGLLILQEPGPPPSPFWGSRRLFAVFDIPAHPPPPPELPTGEPVDLKGEFFVRPQQTKADTMTIRGTRRRIRVGRGIH